MCKHVWVWLAEDRLFYCSGCGDEQLECPHRWKWLMEDRLWWCLWCGAEEDTEPFD